MIGVLGAGAWGTTIAQLLAENGHAVTLWARDADLVEGLRQQRENRRYLPGFSLADGIRPTSELREAVHGAEALFLVVPSKGCRATLEAAAPHLGAAVPVVSATKGFEPGTQMRISQLIEAICPGRPVAVLSGPNLAKEVMNRLPTPSVVASRDAAIARQMQGLLSQPMFRVYTNDDVIGAELGGALKNTIAIAAGLVDELRLGANAKAGLLTRGLAEITRLGVALGANPLTFAGLTGLGDLIATCSSTLSRNHQVGEMLAKNIPLDEALKRLGATAEGVNTTYVALGLAEGVGVEMPIAEAVVRLLEGTHSPQQVVYDLMTRSPKQENY